jgi:hypothetical protein
MARDFTTDSRKWDKATSLDYQSQVRDVRDEAMERVDPSIPCTNWGSASGNGGLTNDCPCRNCTGARAAHAKVLQLAKPDEWEKLQPHERMRFQMHPSQWRNPDGSNKLTDEEIERRFGTKSNAEPIAPKA